IRLRSLRLPQNDPPSRQALRRTGPPSRHTLRRTSRRSIMTGVLLVVIDAQRGFVDPEGSLARAFGIDEIVHSATALTRLRTHVSRRDRGFATVFVRSEYRPAQFTSGRFDDPMAHIC